MPEIFYQASMLLLFLWLFDTSGPLIEPFRDDPPPSFPKSFIGNPHAFKYCGPLIETFRGDGLGVIEAFRGNDKRMIEPFRNDCPFLRHA